MNIIPRLLLFENKLIIRLLLKFVKLTYCLLRCMLDSHFKQPYMFTAILHSNNH